MSTYIDQRKIGEGGFGEVWLCKREEDGALFAKKKLASSDTDAEERFRREVRILSSLDHPHVVRVVGKRLDVAPLWYVMPLYKTSLKAELPGLIGNTARLQVIFGAILSAIEYAHAEGVIHRDLKPDNVLMNSDTDVVVSDFGLGRVLDAESTRNTLSGFGMGTLAYMAPEQLRDAKHADNRSDIFALGRMLYELQTEPLTPTAADLARLTPGMALIVGRATQPSPDKRYQTVPEMKAAWWDVVDATHFEAEFEQLALLRAELATEGSATAELVARFMTLLAKRLPDDDLLHETVMQVDPRALALMFEQDPDFVRAQLDRFASFTGAASWPFTYTDRIAVVCKRLHSVMPDPAIRAALVACVMNVGLEHNRYFVMDVMDAMLLASRGDDAVLAARLLQDVHPGFRQAAGERVDLAKLGPAVRKVLQAQSG